MLKNILIILISLTFASLIIAQSVEIKNTTDHILMQVNDEGTMGAIVLPDTSAALLSQTNKLYNLNGSLIWDGNVMGTSGGAPVYSVGDFAQGGIVFWIDETGQHGLVCAKVNQSGGMRWYAGTFGVTQAEGSGPFSGEMNTSVIIAAQVAIGDDLNTYAARTCAVLEVTENSKTYGDWYLPSKGELDLMYQNKTTIDGTATANSGIALDTGLYWSSTEHSNNIAWAQNLGSGTAAPTGKESAIYVRAIRAF